MALTLFTDAGSAHPLGATTHADGVNFSLFSQDATEVVLLLFDDASAIEPGQVIRLDPFQNKTFHFWHLFVRGCRPGIYYAFRVDGPFDPSAGQRFNPNKVLIGPYAKGISRRLWSRANAAGPEKKLGTTRRWARAGLGNFDGGGAGKLQRPVKKERTNERECPGDCRPRDAQMPT